jgi:hypothetical protein
MPTVVKDATAGISRFLRWITVEPRARLFGDVVAVDLLMDPGGLSDGLNSAGIVSCWLTGVMPVESDEPAKGGSRPA